MLHEKYIWVNKWGKQAIRNDKTNTLQPRFASLATSAHLCDCSAIVPPLPGHGPIIPPRVCVWHVFAIVQLRVKHTYECIGCCALVLGWPPPRRFSQVSEVGAGSRGASQSLGRKGCMLSRPPGVVSVDVSAVARARCDQ